MQVSIFARPIRVVMEVILGLLVTTGVSHAELKDVPKGHWAAADVNEIIARGIMTAPNGKFEGDKPITRRQSAIALTKFAKSILARSWKSGYGHNMIERKVAPNMNRPLSRYEAAAIFAHFGRYAMKGLPDSNGKTFGTSKAMPKQPALDTVPKNDPARQSLEWLTKRLMLHQGTVLVAAKDGPVTGTEFAEDIAMVLIGAVNQVTDEPELNAQIDPPPAKAKP